MNRFRTKRRRRALYMLLYVVAVVTMIAHNYYKPSMSHLGGCVFSVTGKNTQYFPDKDTSDQTRTKTIILQQCPLTVYRRLRL